VNTRAMVVHHHLWSGVVAGVKNPTQAQDRIVSALHRMEEIPYRTIEDEESDESDSANPFVEPENYPYPARNGWSVIVVWAFRLRLRKLFVIRCSLRHCPFLPERAVKYLAEGPSLNTDERVEAIKLLAGCASRYVFESAVDALADRLESAAPDSTTEALAELLREPTVQEVYYPKTIKAARTRLRERLASEDPAQRLRAIKVLALLGDLHDISLLADLAALSESDETYPEERAALATAMEAIARRPVV